MKFQGSQSKGLKFHSFWKDSFFLISTLVTILLFAGNAYASHPLITDDTGTQGKGHVEFETGVEYGHEKESGVTEDTTEIVPVLAYGITDTMDIELCVPYQFTRVKEAGMKTTEDGFSDVEIDLKWCFYEKDGLSFALRPLISFPTGDNEKGLGAGKVGYSLLLFITKEIKPLSIDVNLGYKRNENKLDEREDIWHASLSPRFEVAKGINVVADIGMETNPDKSSDTHPVFLLGGIIYSISKHLDMDIGLKGGLNKPETDYSILAGITFRY